jgi:hypothetical protein
MRKQSEREGASRGPNDGAASHGKKPYRSPHLTVYGDLRRIAMQKGGTLSDGKGFPATKQK